MGFLSKDDIKQANDVEIRKVEVPEWGGHVFVKSLSGRARSNIEAKVQRDTNPGDIRIDIVIGGTCDEDGNVIFTDKDDRKWLQEKNASALHRVAEEILAISGMKDDAVEEAEGN